METAQQVVYPFKALLLIDSDSCQVADIQDSGRSSILLCVIGKIAKGQSDTKLHELAYTHSHFYLKAEVLIEVVLYE